MAIGTNSPLSHTIGYMLGSNKRLLVLEVCLVFEFEEENMRPKRIQFPLLSFSPQIKTCLFVCFYVLCCILSYLASKYRISFVGGKQLSSTGSGGFQESEIKVYPPQDISATTPTVTSTPTPTTTNIKVDDASEEPNATTTSEPEPEPVGKREYITCLL